MVEIIGQKVSHKTLGIGVITDYYGISQNDHKYIMVQFDNKNMKLTYPSAFEKHLTALDPEFAKNVECELSNISNKQIVTDFPKSSVQSRHSHQNHKPLTFCSINEFVFRKEIGYNKQKNKTGFMTFDKTGRHVGVTFMNDDKRKSSYGQAEICFYDEFKEEFGQWRLVAINKERLSFHKLTNILEENGSYEATIDPRKGS